jgi:hypothetical protein
LLVLAERLLKKRLPPKDSAKFFEPSELKDIVFVLFVGVLLHLNDPPLNRSDRWLLPEL